MRDTPTLRRLAIGFVFWMGAAVPRSAIHAESTHAEAPPQRLVGTCVGMDASTPIAGVEITLLPAGLRTTSDTDGDFFFDWNGDECFLELHLLNSAFCGQFVVRRWNRSSGATDRTPDHSGLRTDGLVDLGPIVTVATRARPKERRAELAPGTTPPDEIAESGPEPTVDRLWFGLRADLDRFGRVVAIVHHTGDPLTPDLTRTLDSWMRSQPWITPDFSRCGEPAFRSVLPMAYNWDRSTHSWIRDPNNRPR